MTRRSSIWLAVASLFSVVNLAGAVMAAVQGEALHAGIHVTLFLLSAYAARRIWRPRMTMTPAEQVPGELNARLMHLELLIERLALSVERVGEGQRFITNYFTPNAIPVAVSEHEQRDA